MHNGYNLKNKPNIHHQQKKWIAKGGSIEELSDGTWGYTVWERNVVDYLNGHPVFAVQERSAKDDYYRVTYYNHLFLFESYKRFFLIKYNKNC